MLMVKGGAHAGTEILPNRFQQAGRIAVVTGSSRGIGSSTAVALAHLGYFVVVNFNRNEFMAKETLVEIRRAGSDGMLVRADVSSQAGAQELFSAVEDRFGLLDVLINNAGTSAMHGIRSPAILRAWNSVMEVNATSTMLCIHYALPLLEKSAANSRSPSIVNVSSRISEKPTPCDIAYGCSKAVINALTVGLAEDLGRVGIRINAVFPALTPTDLVREFKPESLGPMGEKGLVATLGETADLIVQAVHTMATGQIFRSPRLGAPQPPKSISENETAEANN